MLDLCWLCNFGFFASLGTWAAPGSQFLRRAGELFHSFLGQSCLHSMLCVKKLGCIPSFHALCLEAGYGMANGWPDPKWPAYCFFGMWVPSPPWSMHMFQDCSNSHRCPDHNPLDHRHLPFRKFWCSSLTLYWWWWILWFDFLTDYSTPSNDAGGNASEILGKNLAGPGLSPVAGTMTDFHVLS
jgi:hypothetical protein